MAGTTIYTWGDNSVGQLGNNSTTSTSSPVSIAGPGSYVAVAAGQGSGDAGSGGSGRHVIAIDINGRLWAWGRNDFGQLGDNSTTNKSSPVSVWTSGSFVAVAAGETHSLAIDSNGMVWSWGKNDVGSLGDNTLTNKSSPVSIARPGSYTAIVATGYYGSEGASRAIDSTGKVWYWGLSTSSQSDHQSSPVSVPTSILASKIAAWGTNTGHLLMLEKTTGRLWSWDWAPIRQVGDTKSYVDIGTGYDNFYAIDSTGMIWAMGRNDQGQLGDNTIAGRSTMASICRPGSYVKVKGNQNYFGGTSVLAIDSNGNVWSWGNNSSGQLGDNTLDNKSSPVSIARNLLVTDIAEGHQFGVAIGRDTPTSVNDFTPFPARDSTQVISTINPSVLMPKLSGDSYFTGIGDVDKVYLYFTHQDGRQQKRIIHSGPTLSGPATWTPVAKAGTWMLEKTKVFDRENAEHDFGRDSSNSDFIMA
jgi:hypothetical protein